MEQDNQQLLAVIGKLYLEVLTLSNYAQELAQKISKDAKAP